MFDQLIKRLSQMKLPIFGRADVIDYRDRKLILLRQTTDLLDKLESALLAEDKTECAALIQEVQLACESMKFDRPLKLVSELTEQVGAGDLSGALRTHEGLKGYINGFTDYYEKLKV